MISLYFATHEVTLALPGKCTLSNTYKHDVRNREIWGGGDGTSVEILSKRSQESQEVILCLVKIHIKL